MATAASAAQPSRSWMIRYADRAAGTSAPPRFTATMVERLRSTGTK